MTCTTGIDKEKGGYYILQHIVPLVWARKPVVRFVRWSVLPHFPLAQHRLDPMHSHICFTYRSDRAANEE